MVHFKEVSVRPLPAGKLTGGGCPDRPTLSKIGAGRLRRSRTLRTARPVRESRHGGGGDGLPGWTCTTRELARLGLQHRVWRSTALACWGPARITVGSRVLDVGAGPGFATVDLAEVVGPTGEVVAVERSARYAGHTAAACRARGLDHVRFDELDLMADPLPAEGLHAAWCRWVACFVPDPGLPGGAGSPPSGRAGCWCSTSTPTTPPGGPARPSRRPNSSTR